MLKTIKFPQIQSYLHKHTMNLNEGNTLEVYSESLGLYAERQHWWPILMVVHKTYSHTDVTILQFFVSWDFLVYMYTRYHLKRIEFGKYTISILGRGLCMKSKTKTHCKSAFSFVKVTYSIIPHNKENVCILMLISTVVTSLDNECSNPLIPKVKQMPRVNEKLRTLFFKC